VKLTTHLHLVRRLKFSGATHLLPLYYFTAWTGKSLPCVLTIVSTRMFLVIIFTCEVPTNYIISGKRIRDLSCATKDVSHILSVWDLACLVSCHFCYCNYVTKLVRVSHGRLRVAETVSDPDMSAFRTLWCYTLLVWTWCSFACHISKDGVNYINKQIHKNILSEHKTRVKWHTHIFPVLEYTKFPTVFRADINERSHNIWVCFWEI
jgi:hypothetical protein